MNTLIHIRNLDIIRYDMRGIFFSGMLTNMSLFWRKIKLILNRCHANTLHYCLKVCVTERGSEKMLTFV